MGGRAGTGVEIEIDLVPQRETGMTPYEIMLSESQERMLLVAAGGREQEVLAVFHKWGLQAVVIGSVIADPHMRVAHHGQIVADIPNAALTDEAPVYHRPQQPAARNAPMNPPVEIPEHGEWAADLKTLLASPTIASKRWIWEQYDYTVCTNTVAGPGGDAAVLRLKETAGALAMSLDGNGRYCWLDAREGAKHAVAEACRNVSATGATPLAATNCLNFGSPENPQTMWQFAEAVAGMSEACRALETPITGGNVSFYNETLGEPIYPTPVMGIVGLLQDAAKAVGSCFRHAERIVALLGEFGDAKDAVRFGILGICQDRAGQRVGIAAGAGPGSRKARAGVLPRTDRRGSAGIGPRRQRRRNRRGLGGVLLGRRGRDGGAARPALGDCAFRRDRFAICCECGP